MTPARSAFIGLLIAASGLGAPRRIRHTAKPPAAMAGTRSRHAVAGKSAAAAKPKPRKATAKRSGTVKQGTARLIRSTARAEAPQPEVEEILQIVSGCWPLPLSAPLLTRASCVALKQP